MTLPIHSPIRSPLRSPIYSPIDWPWGATDITPSAWEALLDSLQSETDGAIWYFTDPDYPRELIRDTTTPANSVDRDANLGLTYTSPNLKNVTGADGLLKYANHNLVTYSQTIGSWNVQASGTVASNQTTAPDGTSTAGSITGNGSSNFSGASLDPATVVDRTYACSVYVKKNTSDWVGIIWAGGNLGPAFVNLNTGATGAGAQSLLLTVTDIGSGWYKISRAWTAISTSHGGLWVFATAADATNTGSGSVYVWGAQFKATPVHDDGTLSDYVATTTAAKYRLPIDHDTNGDPLGLLVEEARTNLCLQSENFGTTWLNTNSSETQNATGPTGIANSAWTITADGASGGHHVDQTLTIVSGTTYSVSVYAKAGTSNYLYVSHSLSTTQNYATRVFDLSDGTLGDSGVGSSSGTLTSSSIASVGNGWYRCTVVGVVTGTDGQIKIGVANAKTGVSFAAGGAVSSTTTGTVILWGAQLEAGSFPTSYIRTTSATVTRAVDNISKATSGFCYSATAGSVLMRHVPGADTDGRMFSLSSGGRIELYTSGSTYKAFLQNGGTDADITSAYSVVNGTPVSGNVTWANNDTALSVDGATVVTDTSSSPVPVADGFNFGFYTGGSLHVNGHIQYLKYLPYRVSNANLALESA